MAVPGKQRGVGPRRSPPPGERQRDPARTRRRILEAAAEEFAAKGVAGARVAQIAAHAGVNQQLISYYFGGKQGLYDELAREWLSTEAVIAAPEVPFGEVVANYLDATLEQPAWARLLIRQGLDGGESTRPDDERQVRAAVDDIRRRQKAGEVSKDFDAGFIVLVLMAATTAPVALPHVVRGAFGDLDSGAARARYRRQLQRLFAPPPSGSPAPPRRGVSR